MLAALADGAVGRTHVAVPLPGDGFAAVLSLEPAARYDVADQMGLDAYSADTGGAAAAADNDSEAATPRAADGSAAPAAGGDGGEAAMAQWAGGQRRLQAAAASTCIGATFTVVLVRG